jgi:hypothetical protein
MDSRDRQVGLEVVQAERNEVIADNTMDQSNLSHVMYLHIENIRQVSSTQFASILADQFIIAYHCTIYYPGQGDKVM